MTQNNKRIIIVSIVLALSIILLAILMLLGLNLGFLRIPSISYLASKYDLVKKTESDLAKTQETYYSTINNLQSSQTEYNKQKNKYNSISDETIEIIKEVTTEESYNLEYMWIKLGNYAKKNNLEIVMVEPGGKMTSNDSDKKATNTSTTNSTTQTSATTNNSTTSSTTNNTKTQNTTGTTSNTSALKIQVTGSYMNTSDFIFEVENDVALKFKLDNISMDYVEGTTIKTTFDVKNITVNK